ncbi:MAG: nitroreductase family protein [Anaerolineae bacterium]|jgi:F420 biosynthesis protein FbiB-like protein|nr:nitroreductase family protein [Anaerolineae bacterium]
MLVQDAIAQRRSIRRYKEQPVSEEDIRAVLHAATLAPSGKNRQPWRFVVVHGEARRAEMVAVMRQGIAKLEAQGVDPGSSKRSAGIMARAPVTVFVFNQDATYADLNRSYSDRLFDIVAIQSIGAAIQNMLLAATDRGLGTLWICDVFYAIEELCGWLGEDHVMVAAVALGHPDEAPGARPRKSSDEVTRWFS